jgi:hypothetical protein
VKHLYGAGFVEDLGSKIDRKSALMSAVTIPASVLYLQRDFAKEFASAFCICP